jgi:nitronate monooxygenase
MGSAFLVAEEAETHPIYAQKVIGATPTDTVISERFSIGWPGRRHRVLAHSTAVGPRQKSVFIARTLVDSRQYPIPRYSATVPTRSTTGSIEEMAMYCGTSCAHISEMASASALVKKFATALTR